MAGGKNGQGKTAGELCELIRSIERTPVQRTTLYKKQSSTP